MLRHFRTLVVLAAFLTYGAAVQLGDDADPPVLLDNFSDAGLAEERRREHEEDLAEEKPPDHHILSSSSGGTSEDLLRKFYTVDKPTIVFADSGVGGLAVMSTFIKNFEKKPLFSSAKLIFFDMAGLERPALTKKIEFIHNNLKPDMLLIACNGMSARYMKIPQFVQEPQFPVLSMLPFGRDTFGKKMQADSSATLIMFVSPITGGVYRTLLGEEKAQGGKYEVGAERMQVQRCPNAIDAIQNHGPKSESARNAIKQCVDNVWGRLSEEQKKGHIYAGMGCTHFGWAKDVWKSELENKAEGDDKPTVEVLDPNDDMAAYLFSKASQFPKQKQKKSDDAGIDVAVRLNREYQTDEIKALVVAPLAAAIDAGVNAQKKGR